MSYNFDAEVDASSAWPGQLDHLAPPEAVDRDRVPPHVSGRLVIAGSGTLDRVIRQMPPVQNPSEGGLGTRGSGFGKRDRNVNSAVIIGGRDAIVPVDGICCLHETKGHDRDSQGSPKGNHAKIRLASIERDLLRLGQFDNRAVHRDSNKIAINAAWDFIRVLERLGMSDYCTRGVDTGFVALGYFKVAMLGVLQGITELMPISSTAHMRLLPAFLGWTDPGSAFSAAMQLAALAAVVSYFWSDVKGLVVESLSALSQGRFRDRSFRFVVWIAIATIPIGVAGLSLSAVLNACNSPLRRIEVVGWACIGLAALLGIAEIAARHRRRLHEATFWDALLVGVAQMGALIPGVSRSGSTLTAALALGFKRDEAARFSFLLGLPAITLAGAKELWELHKIHLSAHGWSVLGVGLVVASISAFFAIWGLMRVLERFSSWPFVAYRFVLGAVILAGAAAGWFA